MTDTTTLDHVRVETRTIAGQDMISVGPVFTGVDRPYTGGWAVNNDPAGEKLASRLCRALEAGAAITVNGIKTDCDGKTYVSFVSHVMTRYMDADLARLGF